MSINETVRENMITLGREGGKGADSIIKAAMFATALVAHKFADKSDGRDLYLAYREGYDGEVILSYNLCKDENTLKSQVSAFSTFMLPDVVKNGEIHGRALEILSKIDPDMRRNGTYNSLVAVNRAQKKKGGKALTNEEMREVLEKDETAEKDLVAKLAALLKAANKIAKDYDTDAPGIFGIVKQIEKAVAAATEARDAVEVEEPVEPTKVIQQDKPTLTVVPAAPSAPAIEKDQLASLLSGLGRVSVN